MKKYARIQDGIVAELIDPATDEEGDEIPIDERFHPLLVLSFVDITEVSPQPLSNWLAVETDGTWLFSAPPVL